MITNKQFEEWLNRHDICWVTENEGDCLNIYKPESFKELSLSMQWGVYLEFFDSVGIIIDTERYSDHFYEHYIKCYGDFVKNGIIKTSGKSRKEAQKEAIKKAFEILEK